MYTVIYIYIYIVVCSAWVTASLSHIIQRYTLLDMYIVIQQFNDILRLYLTFAGNTELVLRGVSLVRISL